MLSYTMYSVIIFLGLFLGPPEHCDTSVLLPCLIKKYQEIFNLNHFILNTFFDIWCYAVESWMRFMQCEFCLQHDEKHGHPDGCCSSKKAWQHGGLDLGLLRRNAVLADATYYKLQLPNVENTSELHDTRAVVEMNTIRIVYYVCNSI